MSIKMMILALGAIVLMVGTGIVFFTMQPRSNNVAPDGAEGFIMGPPLEVGGALPPSVYMPSVGRGSTIGNATNGSRAVQKGDWIYFRASPSIFSASLLRIHETTGEVQTLLNDDSFHSLNIIGDWIIFGRQTGIYRMLINGTGEERLSEINTRGASIMVVNGWIYYVLNNSTVVDGVMSNSGIYRMTLDGRIHESVTDETVLSFSIHNDWIYFRGWGENLGIHKIRTDGTNGTRLSYDDSNYINASDEWIFFTNRDLNNALYKMRTDGTDLVRIICSGVGFVNVLEEWIYFSNFNNDGFLYRVNVDGTLKERVLDQSVFAINLTENWIYFQVGNDEQLSLLESATAPFARARRDGTGFEYIFAK